MATTLLISTFPPFPSLTLTVPSETTIHELPSHFPAFLPSFAAADLALTLPSGALPPDNTPVSALWARPSGSDGVENSDAIGALSSRLVNLRLGPRLRGGKGGFGSQLRAAGGRMSSQKTSNNDSCRDLNGRRLSTIKEAKALATYLESEPERKKAQQEAQRAKLEKLERRLGINGNGKDKEKTDDTPAGVKRRFDDTEYLEQSRDIVDNVKNAVAAGMLKKRKRGKVSPPPREEGPSSSKADEGVSKVDEAQGREVADAVEKVLQSSATAPIAAAASVSLAAIGA
ncbi:hypothetical protein M0805_005268 [Coniferiporia weirii]|nr:hypothetical protein M0805_005268 [Coniferiporia weirii]